MVRSMPYREPQSGVYVSKTLIAAIAIAGALVLGWLGNDIVSHLASAVSASSVNPRSADRNAPVSSEDAPIPDNPRLGSRSAPVAPSATGSPPGGQPGSPPDGQPGSTPDGQPASSSSETTNVYLTIVNPSTASGGTAPTMVQTTTIGGEPSPATNGAPIRTTGGSRDGGGGAANAYAGGSPNAYAGGSLVRTSGSNGQHRGSSGTGSGNTPTRLIIGGGTVMVPNAPGSGHGGGSNHGLGGGVSLSLTPGMAATAIGDHIVIAYDGAIVYVGDHGSMTANSGAATGGGTVALDADSSNFSSNYDPTLYMPNGTSASGTSASHSGTTGTTGTHATTGVLSGGPANAIPIDASPLVSAFISYTGNRTADIAGFEDHSILTRGTGNVVTYDDSNVFMNRDGKINANTGDTDSAGLNAVATLRSVVSAGPHCDDGCDDESIIQAQAGVFDEGDVAIDGDGHVVWSPDTVDSSSGPVVPCDDECASDAENGDDSAPADNGDDSDAAGDESPDGDVSDPAEPAETREEADSTRPAADNGEEPDGDFAAGSLIVGGDGIDDLSERVDGNFNVSTYDDSNVVIGGTGDVNAQIGDSDTGGTVTMDTIDSVVSGGTSR